jgi:hypothetical protein
MSVNDTEVANNTIYRLLENGNADASFPTLLTSQFTSTEIVDAMNRVQQKFLLDTGMHTTRTTFVQVAGTSQVSLPTDSIRPRRLTWTDTSDNLTRALTQVETWELDQGSLQWPSNAAIPIAWLEDDQTQQTLQLALTPINPGTVSLLYIQLAATLTGLGIALVVPDDWTPYILWGTLQDLLSSDGPAFDPLRAQYAQRRYDEGVELAKVVLGGSWS